MNASVEVVQYYKDRSTLPIRLFAALFFEEDVFAVPLSKLF